MHSPSVPPAGVPEAEFWIIQGFPTADDLWRKEPLAGNSGHAFANMLHEAGLLFSEAYRVCASPTKLLESQWTSKKGEAKTLGLHNFDQGYYFSDEVAAVRNALRESIASHSPKVVVPLDDFALWCVCGESSISKWRGSIIHLSRDSKTACIPTYSGAQIFRMWEWRVLAVRDLKRVKAYIDNPDAYAYPLYQFAIRPTISGALQTLNWLQHQLSRGEVRIACDIETVCRHISCIGLAWSRLEAICIPFLDEKGQNYWTIDEEIAIQLSLRAVLTHPNAYVVGQNFNYDNQHFAKHLGYLPNLRFDTMIGHHVLFPGMAKSLDMLSSLYCHFHLYWKDELKDYNKMPDDIHKYWTYNCKDCVNTWEISIEIERCIESEKMQEQSQFLHDLANDVLFTMLRGIAINQKMRSQVAGELMLAIEERKMAINIAVGRDLNIGSPKQMQEFFYEELGLPVQRNRKTGRPSCDDTALQALQRKQPLLEPLIELINNTRSLGVFLSTFCLMKLDSDSRMRTMFNVAGPETFRFSSSENAFGNGGNLQNIPKGDEE